MKRNEIERLLPEIFQRVALPGTPLFALLEIMDALHEPSEEILGNVGPYFDPYQAPDRFVPLLARWVDLERYLVDLPPEATPASRFAPGLGRLRELINAVAFLSKWRGTAKGLRLFLETATGVEGFVIDEQAPGPDGLPRPFHIRVQAPAEAQHYHELIRRVVEMEKPAYVTYELRYGD
jgi:phage tail-like protein